MWPNYNSHCFKCEKAEKSHLKLLFSSLWNPSVLILNKDKFIINESYQATTTTIIVTIIIIIIIVQKTNFRK